MSEPENDRGGRMGEAESRLAAGDLDGARAILVDLVRKHPDDDAILAELDRVLAVAEVGPEGSTYFRTLAAARVARERGDRSVAIRLLTKARSIWDGDAAIRELAVALEAEPEPEEAPEAPPAAIVVPRRPIPWGLLAAAGGGAIALAGGGALVVALRDEPGTPPVQPPAVRVEQPAPEPPAAPPAAATLPVVAKGPIETPATTRPEPVPPPSAEPRAPTPPARPKEDPRWGAMQAAAADLDRQAPKNAAEAEALLAKAQALSRECDALAATNPAPGSASTRDTLDRIVRSSSRLKDEFNALDRAATARRDDEARAGIRAAVEAWRKAQEDLDAAALRRVAPAIDENVQAGTYKTLAWQRIELRDESIAVAPDGDRATAAYAMRLTIQAKKAEAPTIREVKVDVQMVREAGRWLVRRTDFKK